MDVLHSISYSLLCIKATAIQASLLISAFAQGAIYSSTPASLRCAHTNACIEISLARLGICSMLTQVSFLRTPPSCFPTAQPHKQVSQHDCGDLCKEGRFRMYHPSLQIVASCPLNINCGFFSLLFSFSAKMPPNGKALHFHPSVLHFGMQ